jgi:hypothetical protein
MKRLNEYIGRFIACKEREKAEANDLARACLIENSIQTAKQIYLWVDFEESIMKENNRRKKR